MSRAASIATNLAVAVAATAVGCTVVVTLTPAHPAPDPVRLAARSALVAATGHPGAAARAATSALGAGATDPEAELLATPVAGRIEVTAPQAGVNFKSNGSSVVAWTNTTGQQVDIWLNADMGHGRTQRMGMVATKAGAGRTGEAIVTLPRVPPGPHYFLEVVAGDGAVRGFSRTFAVTE
ncbi:hypothetical protein [Streptomyces lydicus]|uniref:hypothetical protein n=1 Tax=Streptomyces lydicus TaxID=47763 RepID=UPI0028709C1E|nr:hypothetical protein [Streptomyces lydicus]